MIYHQSSFVWSLSTYLDLGLGRVSQVAGTILSAHFHELLDEDTEVFPNQMRNIIVSECSGPALGCLPLWTSLKHLPRKTSGRHPGLVPEPPQPHPADVEEQWLYSERWMTEPLTQSLRHPGTLSDTLTRQFIDLYSLSFGHYPQLVLISEGWSPYWLGCLFHTTERLSIFITAVAPTLLSLVCEQDPSLTEVANPVLVETQDLRV